MVIANWDALASKLIIELEMQTAEIVGTGRK